MAKITLVNGSIFEGTPAECAEFQKLANGDNRKVNRTKGGNRPTSGNRKSKAKPEDKPDRKVEFIRDGKVVSATGYLPHAVYTYNREHAVGIGGITVVGKTDKGYFKATFDTVGEAKTFEKLARYDIPNDIYEGIVADRKARVEAYKTEHPKRDNKAIAKVIRDHDAQPVGELWEKAKVAYDKGGLDGVEAMFAPANGKGKGRKSSKK